MCVRNNDSKFCTTPTTVEKEEESAGVSNSVRKEIVGVNLSFCDVLLAKMLAKTDLVGKNVSKILFYSYYSVQVGV